MFQERFKSSLIGNKKWLEPPCARDRYCASCLLTTSVSLPLVSHEYAGRASARSVLESGSRGRRRLGSGPNIFATQAQPKVNPGTVNNRLSDVRSTEISISHIQLADGDHELTTGERRPLVIVDEGDGTARGMVLPETTRRPAAMGDAAVRDHQPPAPRGPPGSGTRTRRIRE